MTDNIFSRSTGENFLVPILSPWTLSVSANYLIVFTKVTLDKFITVFWMWIVADSIPQFTMLTRTYDIRQYTS